MSTCAANAHFIYKELRKGCEDIVHEQIRELQKVQDNTIKGNYSTSESTPDEVRKNATTIAMLCKEAQGF